MRERRTLDEIMVSVVHTKEKQRQNAKSRYAYARSKGFDSRTAAALVGNSEERIDELARERDSKGTVI